MAAIARIALPLANLLLGAGGLGAGIGFTVAEKEKMEELNEKQTTLKNDVQDASDFYDHTYYLVAVNLDRVFKALDSLPTDILEKITITIDDTADKTAEVFGKLGAILGYVGGGVGMVAGVLELVRYLRSRTGNVKITSTDGVELDTFKEVPLHGEEPYHPPEPKRSFAESEMFAKVTKGLNIAGVVFGVASLATTIGLGAWTLDKINKAISAVETKQEQVTKYHTAMKDAMNNLIKAAGLPEKSYDQLQDMAHTWRKISVKFDDYKNALDYAIKGYYNGRTLDAIKEKVVAVSETGAPFPDDGYPIAKTLADDVKFLHVTSGKNAKEIVDYFATDNPNLGLRLVFTKFFVSELLNPW